MDLTNQVDIHNVDAYIEMFSTSTINPTLIILPDLQCPLYHIKDQLQSHPKLYIPANIETGVCNYYTLLKIQVFALTDILLFL